MESIRICETVTASTMAELRARRDAAVRADLVEMRLDGVADVDVAGALQGRRRPVVVTCRPTWDRGCFDGAEETRLRLLAEAIRLGAEYVDVESAAEWRTLPRSERTGLILSLHDWNGVPDDLAERVRQLRQVRPSVVKIAVTARRLTDCLVLRRAVPHGWPTVAIAMGTRGQVTRTCPWLFNSVWTYSGRAAPGQLSTDLLIDRYRVRHGTPATALYAVAGCPLAHSASPAMHNAAFAATGRDAVYAAFEGESAAEVREMADALDVQGLSVTAPFKKALLADVEVVDEVTAKLGVANTLRRANGRWEARNTDVDGFLDPLDRLGLALDGQHAVVLGAGGAARAAVFALQTRGARVAVSARRRDRAQAVARDLGADVAAWPPESGWQVLVNATPVGTWPRGSSLPLPVDKLRGPLVYDLVYNPPETMLMREARKAGASVVGGLEMLVGQACRQFEWWTGGAAPHQVMHEAAEAFVMGEVRRSHEADDI